MSSYKPMLNCQITFKTKKKTIMKITKLFFLITCIHVTHSCQQQATLTTNQSNEKFKSLIEAVSSAQAPEIIENLLKGYADTVVRLEEKDKASLFSTLLTHGIPSLRTKNPTMPENSIKKYATTVGSNILHHSPITVPLKLSQNDHVLLGNYLDLAEKVCRHHHEHQLAIFVPLLKTSL